MTSPQLIERLLVTFLFYFSFEKGKVMEEEKLRGGIRFIENIPRNDLGKIVRPELMKLLKLKL